MTTMAQGSRATIGQHSRPVLPRHAKLRFDSTRELWVLLVPERVLAPDPTAVEVLQLCDGNRRVGQIVDTLAEKFAADREVICRDVILMLQDLADKGFLIEAQEHTS